MARCLSTSHCFADVSTGPCGARGRVRQTRDPRAARAAAPARGLGRCARASAAVTLSVRRKWTQVAWHSPRGIVCSSRGVIVSSLAMRPYSAATCARRGAAAAAGLPGQRLAEGRVPCGDGFPSAERAGDGLRAGGGAPRLGLGEALDLRVVGRRIFQNLGGRKVGKLRPARTARSGGKRAGRPSEVGLRSLAVLPCAAQELLPAGLLCQGSTPRRTRDSTPAPLLPGKAPSCSHMGLTQTRSCRMPDTAGHSRGRLSISSWRGTASRLRRAGVEATRRRGRGWGGRTATAACRRRIGCSVHRVLAVSTQLDALSSLVAESSGDPTMRAYVQTPAPARGAIQGMSQRLPQRNSRERRRTKPHP